MRIYELALVLKPSLAEAQRKKLIDTIKDFLKGLKVTKTDEIGEKQLRYKIKKENKGYYLDFLFEGDNVPLDFEKKIFANENILRHLLIRRK